MTITSRMFKAVAVGKDLPPVIVGCLRLNEGSCGKVNF